MTFGLLVAAPDDAHDLRQQVLSLLDAQDIPFSGFVDAPSPLFADVPANDRRAFLYRAAYALMQPGHALPAQLLATHLSGDALAGNVIRRYTCLQLSLLPFLRPGKSVCAQSGGVLIGQQLLLLPLSPEGVVDAPLPAGVWTELNGSCWTGHLRQMRGHNELPILLKENTLLPIGVNDRSTSGEDADRLTLHYFQPAAFAECTLHDGTHYRITRDGDRFVCESNSRLPWHVIVHQDGEESFLR